jgi:hypothetical protein
MLPRKYTAPLSRKPEGSVKEMELKVKNTAQAVDMALAYLQSDAPNEAPAPGLQWQEKTIYAGGTMDYAVTSKLLSAGDWTIEIYQGVAPLSKTVYQTSVFNTGNHWFWEGAVKADGSLTEVSPFRRLSEEESLRKAESLSKKTQVQPPKPGSYGH